MLFCNKLNLNIKALSNLDNFQPVVPTVHGVTRLILPFEDGDTVNAWLIRDEEHALLFDTGFLPNSAAQAMTPLSISGIDLFLTHDHRDHVGGLKALHSIIKKQHQVPIGQTIHFGGIKVRSIDLAGHCIPATGFVIEGLGRTICITGDALFAGSIGGCQDYFTYQMALRNIGENIFTLPDNTIILPGHGSASTISQERQNNPFFANKSP
jgi:hydroxyacylglutathione hydrolase